MSGRRRNGDSADRVQLRPQPEVCTPQLARRPSEGHGDRRFAPRLTLENVTLAPPLGKKARRWGNEDECGPNETKEPESTQGMPTQLQQHEDSSTVGTVLQTANTNRADGALPSSDNRRLWVPTRHPVRKSRIDNSDRRRKARHFEELSWRRDEVAGRCTTLSDSSYTPLSLPFVLRDEGVAASGNVPPMSTLRPHLTAATIINELTAMQGENADTTMQALLAAEQETVGDEACQVAENFLRRECLPEAAEVSIPKNDHTPILLQFPKILPPLDMVRMRGDDVVSPPTANAGCTIWDTPNGRMGRLVIRKSGAMQLLLNGQECEGDGGSGTGGSSRGECAHAFDVHEGCARGFFEEAGCLIGAGSGKHTELLLLGPVNKRGVLRLNCNPLSLRQQQHKRRA